MLLRRYDGAIHHLYINSLSIQLDFFMIITFFYTKCYMKIEEIYDFFFYNRDLIRINYDDISFCNARALICKYIPLI